MTGKKLFMIVAGAAVLFTLLDAMFVVQQQQQAIVLQFREAVRVVKEPGLFIKVPFIQNVAYYDKRLLPIEPPSQQAILADQKRLVVDAFARYRIVEPLKFFQRLNNERRAADQIGILVNSSMRQVLGTLTMQDVLSVKRAEIMDTIRNEVNTKVSEEEGYGIEIVDVRIRRADLPAETSQSIFARMQSERQREAAQFRGTGQQQSQEIKAKAERERTVLLAEAQKQSEILRGEGDKEALQLVSDATGKDPQFYSFYRSLMAYRGTLAQKDTSYVLSPDSGFFRYFNGRPRSTP
jgi:modulator of FtsH protease HflC